MARTRIAKFDAGARFTRGEYWDWLSIGILLAMLAFAPAAFGAVEAWSELIVIVLAAALSILIALRTAVDREFAPPRTWLYMPLALFILLIAGQMLRLPAALVGILSPAAIATKSEMLGESTSYADAATLSIYPRATAQQLRLVLVGTAVFVAVASVIRTSRHLQMLLLALFTIGCAEALLAVCQIATATGDFYWQIPSGRSLVTSGTFVNYSHFSQFVNLSIGAGLGLLLIQFREHGRHEASSTTWRYSVSQFGWEKYGWLFCGVVLCAIAILASMSRNGAISMFVAAAVVGAALYRRGAVNWKGWLLGAVPLAVVTILLIVGFDLVYERLATLQEATALDFRWEMTAATLRAWSHFPLWGTGLGTHQYVFPLYDRSVTRAMAAHADNDYAQLLEETGIVGTALVALFLGGIASLIIWLARRKRSKLAVAAFGLAYGLIAVAIHSASDFGQHVPANLCLSATICGLLVALATYVRRERTGRHHDPSRPPPHGGNRRRGLAWVGLAAVVAVWGWAVYGAYWTFLGEQWWAAALEFESRIRQSPQLATDDDYAGLLTAAAGAVESDPGNVEYGYWLNEYRWESLGRAVDQETGEVLLHPDVLPHVARIADELAAVRSLCATYGPPYALEGQLRLFVLGDQRGAELIRKGVRLAAYDPPTCLVAGELAAREGQLDEAAALLTRAVELQPEYFAEVVDIYLRDAKRPDLARQLAGDDHARLDQLARALAASPEYKELAEETRTASVASLRHRASTAAATAAELATLARIEVADKKLESAIEFYRRAVALDYGQVELHLELARALLASEQFVEAQREVQICLVLRPQYAPAMQLRVELVEKIEGIEPTTSR